MAVLNIISQALCAASDHLCFGFVVCTADGRILHSNRAAQDMLDEGWPIRRQNGFLSAAERKRVDVLLAGLRQVASEAMIGGSSGASMEISLASFRSSKGIAAATLRPVLVQEHCLIAIYITIPAACPETGASAIAQCCDLTPAEARTLEQFTKGLSVVQAAKALSLSQNTVKTHLRNIFVKTNSSRQQQLLMLACRMKPPLRRPVAAGDPQRHSIAAADFNAGHYPRREEPMSLFNKRSE